MFTEITGLTDMGAAELINQFNGRTPNLASASVRKHPLASRDPLASVHIRWRILSYQYRVGCEMQLNVFKERFEGLYRSVK